MGSNQDAQRDLEILRERKTDERVATETIFRLRLEKKQLRESLLALIGRCDELEAAHGMKVSNLDDGSSWARVGNAVVSSKDLLKTV